MAEYDDNDLDEELEKVLSDDLDVDLEVAEVNMAADDADAVDGESEAGASTVNPQNEGTEGEEIAERERFNALLDGKMRRPKFKSSVVGT